MIIVADIRERFALPLPSSKSPTVGPCEGNLEGGRVIVMTT